MRLKRSFSVVVFVCVSVAWAGEKAALATSTNAADQPAVVPANLPARLREKWDKMPPAKRQEFLRRWEQWQKLAPEARELIRKNYQSFRMMNPKQRATLWEKLGQLQRMSQEETRNFFENFERWKKLSPQEREDLRRRMHNHNEKHHGADRSRLSAKTPDSSSTNAPVVNAVSAAANPQ